MVAADEDGLELRVGALCARAAPTACSPMPTLPGVGNVFQRVADEVVARAATDGGAAELVLRLRFVPA